MKEEWFVCIIDSRTGYDVVLLQQSLCIWIYITNTQNVMSWHTWKIYTKRHKLTFKHHMKEEWFVCIVDSRELLYGILPHCLCIWVYITDTVKNEKRFMECHKSPLQCVAACCSVLQRVAACCSVLQCETYTKRHKLPCIHKILKMS